MKTTEYTERLTGLDKDEQDLVQAMRLVKSPPLQKELKKERRRIRRERRLLLQEMEKEKENGRPVGVTRDDFDYD